MIRLGLSSALAAAAISGTAPASELRRGDDALNFVLQTDGAVADAATFGSRAKITAAGDGFSLGLGAGAQIGREVGEATPSSLWRSTELNAGARWTSTDVQVGLEAGRKLAWSQTAEQVLPFSGDRLQTALRDETSAGLTLGLRMSNTVTLQVGTRTRRWWQAAGTSDGASDGYGATEDSLAVTSNWRLSPALTLEFGASLGRSELAWQGDHDAGSRQAAVQPRLSATIRQGATRVRLSAERAVPPLPLDDVRTAASVGPEAAPLRPAEEWRLQAEVERPIGELFSVSAQLAVAAQERAVELSAMPGGAAYPVNVAAGTRNWASVGLSADLASLGLEGVKLSGRGEWRRSEVADPLTSRDRRASGERPYQGRVEFSQALEEMSIRWGLNAYVAGPTRYYRPRDVTYSSAASGLGGFLAYAPGPFSLEMRIDNLVGGERRSRTDHYEGLRTAGPPASRDDVAEQGTRVMISLGRRI